tara:strand:+ start:210 stop:482 length:273 start_codon:yes stop_codon:yes gene_type:complete
MTKNDIVKKLGLINKLKNELKNRGSRDLEVRILILEKEIDTLKAVIDLKDIEITTLTDNLKKIKDLHNKKVTEKFLDDLANNTPNDGQFE